MSEVQIEVSTESNRDSLAEAKQVPPTEKIWEPKNGDEAPRKIVPEIAPIASIDNSAGNSSCTSSTDGESEDDLKPWDQPTNRKRTCDQTVSESTTTSDFPAEKVAKTSDEEKVETKTEEVKEEVAEEKALSGSEIIYGSISESVIAEEIVETGPSDADSPSSTSFVSSRNDSPANQQENAKTEITINSDGLEEEEDEVKTPKPKQKRTYTRRAPGEKKVQRRQSKKKNDSDDEGKEEDVPVRKNKVVKSNLKDTFREQSSEWSFVQKLKFAQEYYQHQEPNRFSKKQHEKVTKFLAQSTKGPAPIYLSAPITLDTEFPDQGNYRHCLQYLLNATTTVFPEGATKKKMGKGAKTPTTPPQFRLTGPLYLPLDSSAAEVIEAASQWLTTHTNAVCYVDRLEPPRPDRTLLALEREMFHEQMRGLYHADFNRFPVPNLHVKTREEVFDPRFEKILNSASITNVTGIAEALGIDTELFALSCIAKTHPSLKIDLIHQCPQTADTNCNVEGEQGWETTGIKTTSTLNEYSKYMRAEKKNALQAFEKMAKTTTKDLKKVSMELRAEFIADQSLPEDCDTSMQWHKFGTNIDLVSRKFDKQHKELNKLPEFLLPKHTGNLLNYTGCNILGINTVQMYAKPPGARTAAHMENSLMASINWNRGPGVCIWFAVPYEYWGQIEDMVADRKQQYHMQDYWPDEVELLEAGIPVIKFEQKADEMVYVNTGCFHWVQCNGFCVNVSWNVGQPTFTQLATSMVSYSHNIITGMMAHIPLVSAVWNVAKVKMGVEDDLMFKAVKSVLLRSLAHTKWYSDVIKNNGFEIEDGSNRTDFDRIQRCNYCGSEIYNIVKWFVSDDLTQPQYTFCSNCNVPKQYSDGRTEKYTIFDSLEVLTQVYDAYVQASSV